MNRAKRDIIVGLTAILGIVGLALTLMLFGELSFVQPQRYRIPAVVPAARGLGPNANLLLNGVKVGRVTEITTGDDPTLGVRMTLSIDNKVRVPKDVTFSINAGLLGEASLAMSIPLRGLDAAPLPDDAFLAAGDTFESQVRGAFDAITAQLDDRLAGFTDAADNISELADTYTLLGEELRTLVIPENPTEDGVSLRDTIARLNNALDSADAWLGDDALRTSTSETVTQARESFRQLGESAKRFQAVADTLQQASLNVGEDLDEGVGRFVVAAESMTAALEEIRTVASRVNQGEGTLGQLLVNPDLFRNMNDAASRLEKALLEAQLLLEKYRKEGVPIQF